MRTLGLGRMPSRWAALPSLAMPVTAVAGALDDKYVALAQRMADANPAIEIAIIPDSGHNPLLEQPAALRSLFELA